MLLIKLDDVTSCILPDNTLKVDLYNEAGGLMARRGSPFKERLLSMVCYTKDADTVQTAVDIINQKKDELSATGISPATIEMYTSIYDTFRQVIVSEDVSRKTFNNLSEVIESFMDNKSITPNQLHKCVNNIRDKDTYTLHHSMAAMILMYQFLTDLEHYGIWVPAIKEYFNTVDMSKESKQAYLLGALLHDYGKSFIPRSILQKDGELGGSEYEVIKQHPAKGVWELKIMDVHDPRILRLVGNHHCTYCVYKEGQQPLEVVLNILDVYDACRSNRVYKPAMDLKKTLKIIELHQRTVFWPKFVSEFIYKTTIRASETFTDISDKDTPQFN